MGNTRNVQKMLAFLGAVLVLRLWGGALTAPLQEFFSRPEVASFLLYLETGRVVHALAEIPETEPTTMPEETAAPPTTVPVPTEPSPLVLADTASIDIRNSSGLTVDAPALLLSELSWDLTDGAPRVLLLHTHATESFTQTEENPYTPSSYYRTLDTEHNMIRIGKTLAELLEAQGIGVIHDTTLHDYPSYTGSYSNARKTWKQQLADHPGLCLVLDLHRDALESDSGKQLPVRIQTDNGYVAQIMLVVGSSGGGLDHPQWQQNLALALKLQNRLETICPGICRYISLRPQRFNQDLTPGSLLVEVGTAGNTLEEALAATEILAQAISDLAHGTTAGSTS